MLRALEGVDHRGFDPADLDPVTDSSPSTRPVRAERSSASSLSRSWTGSTPTAPPARAAQQRTAPPRASASSRRHVRGRRPPDRRARGQAPRRPRTRSPSPRLETVALEDGQTVDEPDPRHHGQRTHDALGEVCDRLLRSGTLPDSGGTPATVIVTIPEDDLQARRRWGVTSDGHHVVDRDDRGAWPTRPRSTRPSSAETGVVLQLGRTRRWPRRARPSR